MAKSPAKEAKVARKKGRPLSSVQKTKNLLLIVPLRPSNFEADLLEVNAPAAQLVGLVLRNVMVENVHAALLFRRTISRTTPPRVRSTASRTAAGRMTSRYWRAISSAE